MKIFTVLSSEIISPQILTAFFTKEAAKTFIMKKLEELIRASEKGGPNIGDTMSCENFMTGENLKKDIMVYAMQINTEYVNMFYLFENEVP